MVQSTFISKLKLLSMVGVGDNRREISTCIASILMKSILGIYAYNSLPRVDFIFQSEKNNLSSPKY